ncbi:MAG: M67 family metallopeptidase [Thermodesulfovibrionales bacterium]|nr:M67 family metallopeptidase [Thermodesulfovibrionales bacterium]
MEKKDTIKIPKKIYDDMLNYCYMCLPQEACGILGGQGMEIKDIFKVTNIEKSPTSYLMDPAEQFKIMKILREKKLTLVALFHSHPSSPAYPSCKDIEMAFYEDSVYIIISMQSDPPDVRGFFIKKQQEIKEINIFITD